MLKLTLSTNNSIIYINPMHIVSFHTSYNDINTTTIYTINSFYRVKETLIEINSLLTPDGNWDLPELP